MNRMKIVINIAVFSLNRMRPGGAVNDGRRSRSLRGAAACDGPRDVAASVRGGRSADGSAVAGTHRLLNV